MRHQLATTQSEGMYTNTNQYPQIIPVITTDGSDDTNVDKNVTPGGSLNSTETTSNSSSSSLTTIGIKSVPRPRQGGRSEGNHTDRRYHTTGIIEDIKVKLNSMLVKYCLNFSV